MSNVGERIGIISYGRSSAGRLKRGESSDLWAKSNENRMSQPAWCVHHADIHLLQARDLLRTYVKNSILTAGHVCLPSAPFRNRFSTTPRLRSHGVLCLTTSVGGDHGHLGGSETRAKELVVAHTHLLSVEDIHCSPGCERGNGKQIVTRSKVHQTW